MGTAPGQLLAPGVHNTNNTKGVGIPYSAALACAMHMGMPILCCPGGRHGTSVHARCICAYVRKCGKLYGTVQKLAWGGSEKLTHK